MTKLTVAVALIIACSQIVFAQDLSERRAIKEYQESVIPGIQEKINTAAGFNVPLDISWEQIAQPGESENYSNDAYFTDVYFTPLIKALSSVASDDLGKEALSASLKGINITYDPDTAPASAYENGVDFSDGKITLNFKPFSNSSDVDDRADAIVKVLLSSL